MFEFNVDIGLTKKREENNEHSLYDKSSYVISNMNIFSNLCHFEDVKISQTYVINYIILCCNLSHLLYYSIYDLSKTNIFILELQKIKILHFIPELLHV